MLELQDLPTDPLGSNLRNEVDHGLETDGGFFSTEYGYLWWLLPRCVALSAHIVRAKPEGPSHPDQDSSRAGLEGLSPGNPKEV